MLEIAEQLFYELRFSNYSKIEWLNCNYSCLLIQIRLLKWKKGDEYKNQSKTKQIVDQYAPGWRTKHQINPT